MSPIAEVVTTVESYSEPIAGLNDLDVRVDQLEGLLYADLDLHVLQICDNLPLTGLSARELDDLRLFASSKSIALEEGTRGFDQGDLRIHIEIAQRLGSKILRYVPWSGAEELSTLSIEVLFDFIQPLLKDFESFDVTLALENHAEIADEDLVKLISELNSPYVGICLDTARSSCHP